MPKAKDMALFVLTEKADPQDPNAYIQVSDWVEGKVSCRKSRGEAMNELHDGDRLFMLKIEEVGTIRKVVEFQPDGAAPTQLKETLDEVADDHITEAKKEAEEKPPVEEPPPSVIPEPKDGPKVALYGKVIKVRLKGVTYERHFTSERGANGTFKRIEQLIGNDSLDELADVVAKMTVVAGDA